MRWSILLPTYNGRPTLEAAVESVLAQTEADFELLIVGDGCTDDTAAYVTGLTDARVRWFDLPKGPGFGYTNRNVALRESQGEHIAYMAHDDLWAPDHLELLGAAFDATGADFAVTRPQWLSPSGALAPLPVDLVDPVRLAEFRSDFNEVPAVCVAFTRSALEAAGWWPEDVESAGDWELWKRILAVSDHEPAVVPQATTIHFRAVWRSSDTRSVDLLDELSRRHDEWWPAELVVDLPEQAEGMPVQRALQDAISRDPAVWWDSVRRGARLLDGRLATLGLEVPVLEHRIFAHDDVLEEVRSSNGELAGTIETLVADLTTAQAYIRQLEDELLMARSYIEHANSEISRLSAPEGEQPPA
ncbi:glycosyltransferase [Herbiconiux sp. CPCC 203407]|uniref:Glycosyltransferase n=1 Tax=Herbiconiux oxytropis TaxID=2970915 RepID=A0AA42BSR8_9MICO|nr:glycosyltransferase [Herbiconiux oxytropis]MCS5722017.1 glycosyltransferase [Herbiconiux oxytropis]MCS5725600.1 glycosyltransferase [Herbiconiux oxytropis]